jgi:hypothetical protein
MDRKDDMPIWVFLGLMNIETRKGALILFWCSFAFAIFCIPLSLYLEDWSWAAMMFPVTLWYWMSMKWVDKNSSWAEPST